MTRVTLGAGVADLVRQKGGHLILFQAQLTGCCGIGSAPAPDWEIGAPRRPPEEYRSVDLDGIVVHVDHALDRSAQEIHVSLSSWLGWKSLTLYAKEA